MPVYEYQCSTCSNHFELRQKFSDPPADTCPKCGGSVRKMISSTAFALKGGGWYNHGYGPEKKNETPACPKSEGGSCSGCPAAAAA